MNKTEETVLEPSKNKCDFVFEKGDKKGKNCGKPATKDKIGFTCVKHRIKKVTVAQQIREGTSKPNDVLSAPDASLLSARKGFTCRKKDKGDPLTEIIRESLRSSGLSVASFLRAVKSNKYP